MMQAWTPEGMAFLQDAMACCGYYPALARRIRHMTELYGR